MLQVHVLRGKESSCGHCVVWAPLGREMQTSVFTVRLGLSFVEWPQTQHCMLFEEINQIWTANTQERWLPSLLLWVIYHSPGRFILSFIPQDPGERNATQALRLSGGSEKAEQRNPPWKTQAPPWVCVYWPSARRLLSSTFAPFTSICPIYIHLPVSVPSKDSP